MNFAQSAWPTVEKVHDARIVSCLRIMSGLTSIVTSPPSPTKHTVPQVRELRTAAMRPALLPEVDPFPVSRYPLPNLRAVNFVVHGLLGWGVASNLRLDTQAKGLGELVRSRPVEVPAALVASGPVAARLAAG